MIWKYSLQVCLVIFSVLEYSYGSLLPSYIKPCYEDDPKLQKCIKKEARRVLRKFAEGVPELEVPPLEPLFLGDINILQGNLKIRHKNCVIVGISNSKIIDFGLNNDTRRGTVKLTGDGNLNCNYSISGQLLLFPITGKGEMFIKLKGFRIDFDWLWDLRPGKDGLRYAKALDFTDSHSFQHVAINMTGLFNNDRFLANAMLGVMNENWRDLMAELAPTYIRQIGKKIINIFNDFFVKVPYEEMFPKTPTK